MRELRANLKDHFDKIEQDQSVLIVPRKGSQEAMVIMTLSEYSSMKETDYLLSNPHNRQMLEESMRQLDNGDTMEYKSPVE